MDSKDFGPRLLEDKLTVGEIHEKWQELQEACTVSCRLQWSRKFLRHKEKLNKQDPVHAALSFRHALGAYLLLPVHPGDDEELIAKIGGAILCSEFGSTTLSASALLLQDEDVLRRVLPAHLFKDQEVLQIGLQKWRTWVLEFESDVRKELKRRKKDGLFGRMAYTWSLLQRTRLFGSHGWPARQIFNVPARFNAVTEAPKKTMTFNLHQADAQCWIFVDLKGVYIFDAEGAMGQCVPRVFWYKGRQDVLLKWGARRSLLQLVVKAADASGAYDRRGDGTAVQLLTFYCQQASDAVYAIFAALTEPKPEVESEEEEVVVDVASKEQALDDEAFEKLFGMSKDDFEDLPKWKQVELKKKHGFF